MRPLTRTAAALAVALALPACGLLPDRPPHEQPVLQPVQQPVQQPGQQQAARGTAAALLATLPVKGRAPRTGYSRKQFGPAWADTDRNGCDTRNDVLARDLTQVVKRGRCVVVSGVRVDPYTGRTLQFQKARAGDVQVDHVVSLSGAWQTGAQSWSAAERLAFANDPLDLLAVEGAVNSAKGDGDAATWLPPRRGYRCAFVARQVAVKAAYGLWLVPAERAAMERVLAGCPGEAAPTGGRVPPARPSAAGSPVPSAETGPAHGTCRAVEAAGEGPYVRGRDPEYGSYRDADGDGTVCE